MELVMFHASLFMLHFLMHIWKPCDNSHYNALCVYTCTAPYVHYTCTAPYMHYALSAGACPGICKGEDDKVNN